MGLFRFVGQVVDIFAVFPQGHALIVMSAIVVRAYSMRIANEERAYLLLLTKVDHFAGSFVAHITDTPFCTFTLFVLRMLQLLPTTRVFLTTSLFLGNLP